MKTLGIDLASQANRTAACIVEWGPTRASLAVLATSATDDELIAMAEGCDGIGIDAPFGWPEPFVEFVRGWHDGQREAPPPWTTERRDDLRYRLTDAHVARRGGRPPLSVSPDRIALPALRCAGLLHRLGVEDRSGGGRVNEVYPAAALRTWHVRCDGYKRQQQREVLAALARELLASMPWLDVPPEARFHLERDDNAFDALACALVARAARLGFTEAPPPDLHARAAREGWIAIPTVPLSALLACGRGAAPTGGRTRDSSPCTAVAAATSTSTAASQTRALPRAGCVAFGEAAGSSERPRLSHPATATPQAIRLTARTGRGRQSESVHVCSHGLSRSGATLTPPKTANQ